MPNNIEIKAKLHDVEKTRFLAEQLNGHPPQIIEQEDIFFCASNGRLKLRIFSPAAGELIAYSREDISGPKPSTYHILKTDNPAQMRQVLAASLGEKIIVRKVRQLFFAGRARIHIDVVENLGNFLELEVVLNEHKAPQAGHEEAKILMNKLGIDEKDLIKGAYADLLQTGQKP